MLTKIRALCLFLALAACSSDESSSSAGASGGGSGGSGAGGPGPGVDVEGGKCATDSGLPAARLLPNLRARILGSTARITFDPQANAADYRVYALPKKDDVEGDVIRNATYRCAGQYEVPTPAIEDGDLVQSGAVRTRVASTVAGYARTRAEATLGWVSTAPGPGLVPVYALGDSAVDSDNVVCYFHRWPESRVKRYTASESERAELLAKRYRDDGIAFYVPEQKSGTRTVYGGEDGNRAMLYLAEGAEHTYRTGTGMALAEAFSVFAEEAPGLEPLMRVYYEQVCARGHDELVAGLARFEKAYKQGAQPVAELRFTGITERTTLVVEAVDELCPFQGILSAVYWPASTYDTTPPIEYPAFLPPEKMREASPTGELFINGHGDRTAPRAVARACVEVEPAPEEPADWRYDNTPETFVLTQPDAWTIESKSFLGELWWVTEDRWGIGPMFGELRTTFADAAADTNGKIRLTPKVDAAIADDTFLHARMDVDTVSTDRRYPQMLISDQPWPVQQNLPLGNTIVVQTRLGPHSPTQAQIEYCDHRNWDVNDQCPLWNLYVLEDDAGEFLAPQVELNGIGGVDRTVLFDVYASTSRVYLFLNGAPYGCVNLPASKFSPGPVTVTFGDVLYHSAVDFDPGVPIPTWYGYHETKMHHVTTRHFSNLEFTSGVRRPAWDENRMPCVGADRLGM
jgi:hypothetical protein